MNSILLGLATAALGASAPADQRPSYVLPTDIDGKSILYIGAHPDDEWGFAPVLSEACIDRGAKCHFVVASKASIGGCLFTMGLHDLKKCGEIRQTEMRNAAAIFGGDVGFLGLDDLFYSFNEKGRQRTIGEWATAMGSRQALVARFQKTIRAHRPRLLFTFDPRHGSSCHAGHLAVAELVVEAVRGLPTRERPEVWLEQTDDIEERSPENKKVIDGLGFVNWPDTASETVWYDGNVVLRNGKTAYDHAVLVRKTHSSQFPDEASGKKVATAPASARFVPLARLTDRVSGEYCTALALKRPTLDLPENQERLRKFLSSPK